MTSISLRRARAAAGALALTLAGSLNAQTMAARDLPRPSTELDDPLSLITLATEFRPGQLLAVDGAENVLVLADFNRGSRRSVGRVGSGPGEFRGIGGLMKLRGDTVWVYDAAQRIVVFLPDLNPGTTYPLVPFDASTSTTIAAPIIADARGMMYASGMRIEPGTAGTGRGAVRFPDTATVLRFDPRGDGQRSTLGVVKYPTGNSRMEVLSQTSMKFIFSVPGLGPSDAWTVFPDGRVAIVYGDGYRVPFVRPDGTRSAMMPIAYERIPMTEADRRAEVANLRTVMAAQEPAIRRQIPPQVQMAFELTEPTSWPTHYPAISPLQALAAPSGDLWVKRATPARADREMWDVIDRNGKLVARWRLPLKTTIVAVGASNTVYTSRADDDDLRYLQRVVLPDR